MKIQTRDFGEMEIDISEIIHFKQPVYGFEALQDYVLLYDDSLGNSFIWLQSVEQQEICFVMVDPGVLPTAYHPQLPTESLELLNLAAADAVVRVIAVIPEDFTQSTANLKSPIVLNPGAHCAAQVMLEEDYPIRAPLLGGGEGERQAC